MVPEISLEGWRHAEELPWSEEKAVPDWYPGNLPDLCIGGRCVLRPYKIAAKEK